MKRNILICFLFLFATALQSSSLKEYSIEKLEKILVKEFHPYPTYGDDIWFKIPDSIRLVYINQAEMRIHDNWESLPASLFMEYKQTGDRNRYQNVYFKKRSQLTTLAMGELLEGKGRFILPLINGILSTCEETWWGLPAHYGTCLPQPEDQTVALFAAQTAGDLALIQDVFRHVFDSISPLLNQRITHELKRRILEPCRTRTFKWMTEDNNWNPWITSHWITVALIAEKDISKRAEDISLALKAMDYYYSHYRNDGGCDEGPGYWASSCGCFFNCNYLLYKATDGKIDLRNEEKFHRMGEFICKVYMGRNNRFVNFADASPRTNLNPGMVYEYGKFIGNNTMMGFGALKAKESIAKKEMISNGKGASINGFLYTLLSTNEIIEHPAIEPFTRDCFFPDLQVFITRSSPQSDKGLSYAIKGGHNDESHNHNDVGNYIVYADGEPLIIDVGALAYNAKYFSKDRYTFWAVSSDYHNTPIINGFIQKEEIKYAATSVSAQGTKNKGTFTLDLAGAYPVEAAVISWTRKLSLYRQRNILYFSETYILKEYKAPSSIILMTAALVEKKEDGILSLRLNNKNYSLKFNPNQLSAMIEEVEHNDASIKNMWGKVYRIKLQINSQELHNRVTYSLSEIPNNKI